MQKTGIKIIFAFFVLMTGFAFGCVDTETQATADSSTPTSEELYILVQGSSSTTFSRSQFTVQYENANARMNISATGPVPGATITFNGSTSGNYDVATNNATFTYTDGFSTTYTATSGSVAATYVGGPGDYVSGNFSVTANDGTASTFTITGNWNRARSANAP